MFNTLKEQFAVISLDSLSQGGLGFYFLCHSCLVTDTNSSISSKLVTPISNLKLKLKPLTLIRVPQGCSLSMLLYINAAVKYLQF